MFPFLAVCLVVSSNIASVMSSFTVLRSSVVLIGDRVEMKCNGSDWTKWTYTAWNTSSETDIYLGGQIVVSMRSRYKVDNIISEQHNLIIDSVDLAHAGRYRCIAIIQETLSTDVQLTVLGPHCTAYVNEEHIDGRERTHLHLISWCSISYTGNGFPVFSWTKSNAEKNIAENTTTYVTDRGLFTKTSLIIQQLHANDSGVILQCRITFQIPNNGQRNAITVYEYTWNYTLSVTSRSVVITGDRVVLNCNAIGGDSTTWTYTAWNSSTERSIYLNGAMVTSMRSRYKIDKKITGHHNLIIDSVDFAHAGRYECTSTTQQSLMNDVHLVVLGSSPECSAKTSSSVEGNTEKGYLWMWCRIIYTGNMIPIFTWSKENTTGAIAANTTSSDTSRLPLITVSSVSRHLQSDDNGATFKCKIIFLLPNIPIGKATDYEYNWSYTLYGPRNFSIVEYEDRLECSADGIPTPNYRWKRFDTHSSMEGPVLLLDDKDQTFQCTATNVFASERKNFTTNVFNKKYVLGIPTVGLVLIIATLAVFGIVELGIGLKLRKRSIALDEASARNPSLQPKQSSQRLNSPPPTDEYAEVQMADASDNYCAFTDRSAAAQQTEVYCELRTVPNKRQTVN